MELTVKASIQVRLMRGEHGTVPVEVAIKAKNPIHVSQKAPFSAQYATFMNLANKYLNPQAGAYKPAEFRQALLDLGYDTIVLPASKRTGRWAIALAGDSVKVIKS